ncbi:glutathione peroxidase [Flavobacterium aciduliphilum]|uniref:Glutathione peroxidase n=1 Tax=Flavobacterium aciduliphilum TaxID=1101402 RepID=A0A328YKP6_9FLAO|nr:glutathione peroxidase [Flavobacterium aciduliphilum]RAR73884.1 glutathione peroxidase [Flavobacterium aciduliphilum]
MKKLLSYLSVLTILIFSNCQGQQNVTTAVKTSKTESMKQNIYQFKVQDLSGNSFDFVSLKGKKILVVNTASKCGLTPQYKDLEALYKKYKDKNFCIVGFPANNFAAQEPGTNEEISTFCQKNYGVTFPMMAKVSVKGSDMCEVYKFLTEKSKNGLQDSEVEWNFQKYLINEKGELEHVIAPRVLPTDASITTWIEK